MNEFCSGLFLNALIFRCFQIMKLDSFGVQTTKLLTKRNRI